ncbi:actin-like protein 9 [Vipera latastei]
MSISSSRPTTPDPLQETNPGFSGSKSPEQKLVRLGHAGKETCSPGYASDQRSQSWTSSKKEQPIRSRSHSPHKECSIVKTRAIVIDTGTGTCKAGFAGQQTPQVVIGALVGQPIEKFMKTGSDIPDTFIGEQARLEPDIDIIFPLRHGIITDWEAAETLWWHIFQHELKIAPEDHALLMSDPPLSPTTNREKLVEVVFESLSFPKVYVAYQSVLSVYAHGKISGLIVDTGHAVTHTVPVYQGYNLPHATEKMDIAGANVTSFLMDLLKNMGHYLDEKMLDVIEDIKQKCCYVALDFETECNCPEEDNTVQYQLPDGQIITLGKERFQCSEMLFNPPQMPGLALLGIPGMAQKSLMNVPEQIRKEMYKNIMLCGGSSLFEGFKRRFTQDIMTDLETSTKIKVTAFPLRHYSVWTGGSVLASLKNFQSCWITKEQYQEHGPYIVHRKCY